MSTAAATYRRIHHEDLVRTAEIMGSHFFDAQAMKFFNSYLVTESTYTNLDRTVYVFGTSEKHDDEPRRYTARVARVITREDGTQYLDINEADGTEFQEFKTRRAVNKFIAEYVGA